jgi:hypothetical protein
MASDGQAAGSKKMHVTSQAFLPLSGENAAFFVASGPGASLKTISWQLRSLYDFKNKE